MNAVAMQTVSTQRAAVVGKSVRPAARVAVPRCRSVVVRASAEESRRAVLGGLLAGVAALSIPASALAIDLVDDRKVRDSGFDIIYEARDLDLPQAQRDGFTQARTNVSDTQKRIKESEKRIDDTLEPLVKKQYWTLAREELRGQVGTLRFDLGTLVDTKGKSDKKKANELKKSFLLKAEQLDYALREKNQSDALAALQATKSGLDNVISFLL
ncbi:hypothetical protein WJX72_005953 [[Myrmecia] bisecta]